MSEEYGSLKTDIALIIKYMKLIRGYASKELYEKVLHVSTLLC